MKKMDFEIVIGVTGLLAAGKDVLTDRLIELGFGVKRTSDPIRTVAADRDIAEPTREQLQDIGNWGRTQGLGFWALEAARLLSKEGHTRVAINGLRHSGEVEALRKEFGDRFVLVGIEAPTMVRFRRVAGRNRTGDSMDIEGFLKMDDRDRGIGEPWDGQRVDLAMACVQQENRFCNDGTLKAYHGWIQAFLDRVLVKA
ncbi:MAG: hypothetical protein U9Q03_02320 [Patescibacteria group bacterium]|nr:hypothetical protein [Patescibacteria group bacterium]